LTVANGSCAIPSGAVTILGNLLVANGGTLFAASPAATVTVLGGVYVYNNSTLIFGCAPSFGCETTTNDSIRGNLLSLGAREVILHGDTIGGSVTLNGGGGGLTCNNFINPVFSDIEDNTINGSVSIISLRSCYLGFIRNHVGSNVFVAGNAFADPDANEITTNIIGGYLQCFGNIPGAQFGDTGGTPNIAAGGKTGECGNL